MQGESTTAPKVFCRIWSTFIIKSEELNMLTHIEDPSKKSYYIYCQLFITACLAVKLLTFEAASFLVGYRVGFKSRYPY